MTYPYIFFGSPRFAEIILARLLHDGFFPSAVVCNPDRPVGRKGVSTPPPVKIVADKAGIPVLQYTKIDVHACEEIKKYMIPGCVGIVAAYSRILPSFLIGAFEKGIIGVHPSLLPLYRGATPIQSVLLNGETKTGVTLYLVDEQVDHGSILSSAEAPISNEDTYKTLEESLAQAGAELLIKTFPAYVDGDIIPIEQNHEKATYTKKFKTEDGFVDFGKDDPRILYRKIRALSHEPGVYAMQDGKRIKIQRARWEDGKVVITRIVQEGKKPKDVHIQL